MLGVNAETGRGVAEMDHLRQSVRDILTTPIGSRVMRREYGSRLYELVDAPINGETLVDLYAATYEALSRWEPRIDVQQVTARVPRPGAVELTIEALYRADGRPITIDGIEVAP